MDHSCEKCGAVVDEGRPFCPQCRAPQIHVQIAISDGGTVAAVNDAAEGPSLPPTQATDFAHLPAVQHVLSDRHIAVRAALKAGGIGLLIGIIPVLGIVLTGALAVYFYRREKGFAPPAGIGARLGAAAGVVVFAINALFTIPIIVFHLQQRCVDALAEIARKFGVDTAAPQFQAGLRDLFTPSGLASSFIVTLLLASVGGALAAMIFRPSSRL